MTAGVVLESEGLVQPEGPAKERKKQLLSPLGHFAWFVHYRTRFVFFKARQGAPSYEELAARLKQGLAKALRHFFPVGGRLSVRPDGRMEIDCNGQGVYFVKASAPGIALADLEGEDGSFDGIDPSLLLALAQVGGFELKWPWPADAPLFFAQVTRFSCGGLCISFRFSHQAMDGTSAWTFFQAWAKCCRGETILESECNLGEPLKVVSSTRQLTETTSFLGLHKRSQLSNGEDPKASQKCVNRSLRFSRDSIAELKQQHPGFTTFQLLTSLIWQRLTLARTSLSDEEITTVNFAISCRSNRISYLPSDYFGMGAVIVSARLKAGKLRQDLCNGALVIKEATEGFTRERFEEMVELVESFAGDAENAVFPKFQAGKDINAASSFHFPVYEDFGWGMGVPDGMTIVPTPGDGRLYYFPGKQPGSVVCYVYAPPDAMSKLCN